MATLREYFSTDFTNALSADFDFKFVSPSATEEIEINVKVGIETYSKALFIAFYVPNNRSVFQCSSCLLMNLEKVLSQFHQCQVNSKFISDINIGKCGSQFSIFSRKIYLYLENDLNPAELAELDSIAKANNLCITVRSTSYVKKKMELEKPLAFISHDTRDKENVAKPIAIGLQRLVCPVWYDEYSLKVGDKLRESIEKGLKETKKCILILSHNFIKNEGWTKTEFNSIFIREMIEKNSVILPIWVEVSAKDVYEYCPSLADRVALKWTSQENEQKEIIRKLYREII